jgi:hypothetical protein
MLSMLDGVPETINRVFDILELVIVRLALLGLAALGAWSLLSGHFRCGRVAGDASSGRPGRAT